MDVVASVVVDVWMYVMHSFLLVPLKVFVVLVLDDKTYPFFW